MAWETRERGGSYYTRSRKVGGRVEREYIGAGPAAELAAQLDARKRKKRQAAAAACRAEKGRLDALDASVSALADLTDLAVEAALLVAGFHRHKRQWRKKRHGIGKQADDSIPPEGSDGDLAARQ